MYLWLHSTFYEKNCLSFEHGGNKLPLSFSPFQSQINICWSFLSSNFVGAAESWASLMLPCPLMKAQAQQLAWEQKGQGQCQILPIFSILRPSLVPHGSLPSQSLGVVSTRLLACYVSDNSSTVLFWNLVIFHPAKNFCGMKRLSIRWS